MGYFAYSLRVVEERSSLKLVFSISCALLASAHSFGVYTQTSLEKIALLLRSDVRVIAIGDSYSTPFWPRTATSSLRVWPIEKISALGGGTGVTQAIVGCFAKCSPYSKVAASDALGYTVERQNKKPQFFTLPIGGLREIYTDMSFSPNDSSGTLFELKLNIDELETSVHGPFSQSGDTLKMRLLYRCPSNSMQQPSSLILQDDFEDVLTFDPRNDARKFWHLGETPDDVGRTPVTTQINAVSIDISADNLLGGTSTVRLKENGVLQGTNVYFQLAGAVYYHTDALGVPSQGLYFTSIADDSWRYGGYGSGTAGDDTHDKQFSLEQFTHWLDVTTLSRNQPVVFMWMFDVEQISFNSMKQQFLNMIDQADDAVAQVGITESHHLIITPHMFNFAGGGDVAHSYMQQHEEVAEIVATARENVATVSIYEATDGMLFNGTNFAAQWLIDHGFDDFEYGANSVNLATIYYGNLLDNWGTHPRNNDAAAFFAAIVGNELRKAGCPADLVPNGVIGINDVLVLIDFWGDSDGGDVNGDGVTNISDLLMLIDSWGECWPVQAPFSTGQFE